jgi:hypothetical protein
VRRDRSEGSQKGLKRGEDFLLDGADDLRQRNPYVSISEKLAAGRVYIAEDYFESRAKLHLHMWVRADYLISDFDEICLAFNYSPLPVQQFETVIDDLNILALDSTTLKQFSGTDEEPEDSHEGKSMFVDFRERLEEVQGVVIHPNPYRETIVELVPLKFCDAVGGEADEAIRAKILKIGGTLANRKVDITGSRRALPTGEIESEGIDEIVESGMNMMGNLANDERPILGWKGFGLNGKDVQSLIRIVLMDEFIRVSFDEPLNRMLKGFEIFLGPNYPKTMRIHH